MKNLIKEYFASKNVTILFIRANKVTINWRDYPRVRFDLEVSNFLEQNKLELAIRG